MGVNMKGEIAVLKRMTVSELRGRYADVFGEQSRSFNRTHLVRRIAWRLQARIEGDISTRARARALEIADDADLRTNPPAVKKQSASGISAEETVEFDHDTRLPMPGTLITRTYKGSLYKVRVLPDGFEYKGETYRSLTGIAEEITGSHWNGYNFFKLDKGGNGNGKQGRK